MCFGKRGSYSCSDDCRRNHLTDCINANHKTASNNNIVTSHQIPDQLCISKHHNQRSHKEQCIQKCRKESGNSTGYIRICLFVNSSVNESNTDTIKNTRSKTLYRRHKRIDLKQSRSKGTDAADSYCTA